MIKTLEKTAKTEDAAVSAALEELGLDRDDVSVEILVRAKSGFFGIGASPAVVRVSYEAPDEESVRESRPRKAQGKPKTSPKATGKKPSGGKEQNSKPKENKPENPASNKTPAPKSSAPKASAPAQKPLDSAEEEQIRAFLTGLFQHMGIEADMDITARQGGGIDVRLSGDKMGSIIGRRGETLDAIQHLTNYAVNHGSDKHMHINVDAESYRSRREDSLNRLAVKMAEKAIKYNRSMALEPMNSYERHIIHTALQDYEGVTTSSSGEEPNRRVVVTPVKGSAKEEKTNKPSVKEWA